jgi:hypothetical protein
MISFAPTPHRRLACGADRFPAARSLRPGFGARGTGLGGGEFFALPKDQRRCGRRMGLHYSGQHGNYPVYLCRADQYQHGEPRYQEVRALGVDAAAERLLLEALTPDRLALAIAALGELENEARALERQWSRSSASGRAVNMMPSNPRTV